MSDIDADEHPLQILTDGGGSFKDNNSYKNKDVNKYNKKLKEIVERIQNGYDSEMTVKLQELTTTETNLTRVIDKMNVVDNNIDGFIQNDSVIIYDLTATTEVYSSDYSNTFEELEGDLSIISDKLNELDTLTKTLVGQGSKRSAIVADGDNRVYQKDLSMDLMTPFFSSAELKRYYLIFFSEVLNNKSGLIEELKKVVQENKFDNADLWKASIENIVNLHFDKFTEAKGDIKALFDNYQSLVDSTSEFKDLPYPKGKVREFNYSNNPSPSNTDKKLIQNLYTGNNEGPKDKWNNKVKFQ